MPELGHGTMDGGQGVVESEGFLSNGWESRGFHDAPAVLLSRMFDDAGDFDTIRKTFLDPQALSPRERRTYIDSMKEALGARDGLSGALVETALNPWVWLAFLTSPGGPASLRAGGRLFGGKAYSAYVNRLPWILRYIGDASMNFDGTALPSTLMHVADRMNAGIEDEAQIVGGSLGRLLGKIQQVTGSDVPLRSLDPRQAQDPVTRDFLRRFLAISAAHLRGLDRANVDRVPRLSPKNYVRVGDSWIKVEPKIHSYLRKVAEEARLRGTAPKIPTRAAKADLELPPELARGQEFSLHTRNLDDTLPDDLSFELSFQDNEWVGPAAPRVRLPNGQVVWDTQGSSPLLAWLDDNLGTEGREYLDSIQKFFKSRFVKMFADDAHFEGTGSVRLDRNKIRRLYPYLKTDDKRAWANDSLWNESHLDFISGWLDPEMIAMVRQGKISEGDWENLAYQALKGSIGNDPTGRIAPLLSYFPRNTHDLIDNATREVIPRAEAAMAPGEWSGWATSRAQHRRRPETSKFHPDDLELVREAVQAHGDSHSLRETDRWIGSAKKYLRGDSPGVFGQPMKTGSPAPNPLLVARLDLFRAMSSYARDTWRTITLLDDSLPAMARVAMDDFRPPGPDAGGRYTEWRPGVVPPQPDVGEPTGKLEFRRGAPGTMHPDDVPQKWRPSGGTSVMDVLVREHDLLADPYNAAMLREIWLPRIMGTQRLKESYFHALMRQTQRLTRSFVDSGVGKAMIDAAPGKLGRSLGARLEAFATAELDPALSRMTAGKAARYLYSTHMGANIASVVLNAPQPFMYAGSWLGYWNILKAYPRALKQLWNYARERVKLPLRISDAQRQELIHRSFPLSNVDGVDLLDISHDLFDQIDQATFSKPEGVPESTAMWALTALPMKLFEKVEILNRVVVGEAAWGLHTAQGALKSQPGKLRAMDDVRRMVQRTQYGASAVTMPAMFANGGPLDDPLLKQFLPFQVRTVAQTLYGGGRIGATRKFGLGDASVQIPWWLGDSMRMVGASALAYEFGQNVLGADLSRGMAIGTVSDLVGGPDLVRGDIGAIPLPPVVSIPLGFVRGVAGGDTSLMASSVMRLLPAGVAIQRALGAFPDLSQSPWTAPLGAAQREYADWLHPDPAGNIPVFKGNGMLKEARPAWDIVLKGIGADLSRYSNEGEAQSFLVKNQQEMGEMRRLFVQARLSGDHRRADSIAKGFEEKYGMPLMVKQAQWDQALRNRQTPRIQRTLNQIPADVRPQFAAEVGAELQGPAGASFTNG